MNNYQEQIKTDVNTLEKEIEFFTNAGKETFGNSDPKPKLKYYSFARKDLSEMMEDLSKENKIGFEEFLREIDSKVSMTLILSQKLASKICQLIVEDKTADLANLKALEQKMFA